jgi:DNA invertase Pin-like site-specific DNA recombinase
VIYLRQSFDRHGDRLAVQRQLADLQRLAAQRGLDVVLVIEDNDTSATNLRRKRKGYTQLMAMVKAGQVDIILSWAVDRLVRRMADLEALIDTIEAAQVSVLTLSGDLDLSTPQGRLVARILAAVARQEIEVKSARTVARNRQAAQNGTPIATGRRTPGYVDNHLSAIHPEEAPVIAQGYSQLLAGTSVRTIAKGWNGRGFRTGTGAEWRPTEVKRALLNPRYAGLSVYQAHGDDAEVLGTGQWSPIIPQNVWEAARVILSDPARRSTMEGTAVKYLLVGIAQCDECGAALQSYSRGQGPAGRKYRCPNFHITHDQAALDQHILEVMGEDLARADAPEEAVGTGADQAALTTEAAALRVRADQLMDLFADGTITKGSLERGQQRITQRLQEIAAERADSAGSSTLAPFLALPPEERAAAFMDRDQTPLEVQRALVRLRLASIRIGPGKGGRRPADAPAVDESRIALEWAQ